MLEIAFCYVYLQRNSLSLVFVASGKLLIKDLRIKGLLPFNYKITMVKLIFQNKEIQWAF
jgi:hypothetical protein